MRAPSEERLPGIAALLAESGLPTDDLREQDLSLFRIAESSRGIDAVGGLERCGGTALLRSLATAPAMRGRGLAGAIVDDLEQLAIAEGIAALYLLTESAAGYFAARGYTTLDRSDVPRAIRASRQFSSLCPASATVMRKRITG